MNLSPVGPDDAEMSTRIWTLIVGPLSSQGEAFADIVKDLELEFHVAYQERLR